MKPVGPACDGQRGRSRRVPKPTRRRLRTAAFSGRSPPGARRRIWCRRYCGLVPREYSSGSSSWRGSITGAGNVAVRSQLVKSGMGLSTQADGHLGPIVWAAQVRLCGRYPRLSARKGVSGTVAAAIARELSGFVWAEMTAA
ncbi:MAG: transposase [Nitrososphaerales archaeon]